MKRIFALLWVLLLLTANGCGAAQPQAQVAATTLPVYEFTLRLCTGTGISVTRLVTENVSCLHDYSLSVRQVRAIENAELLVLSGAGLEGFMADVLAGAGTVTDSSAGIPLLVPGDSHHHEHSHSHEHEHDHDHDPHIWLSPENAKRMAQNICVGLTARYPQHEDTFEANLQSLSAELDTLLRYGRQELAFLSCRELITFHDGFAYFAEAFDLTILKAIEEESGSEASAAELRELIGLVREHSLPAVFTERSGSVRASEVICAETGIESRALDMAMAGSSYFDAMYYNIQTIKEALG